MRKLKTRNEYVGCNNKCRFYADEIRATSYGHWDFVKVINGKVIFNDYKYSNTTSRHQEAIKSLLWELGISIDAYVYMNESLSEYSFTNNALESHYYSMIKLVVQNNTKRVRKRTIEANNRTLKRWKEEVKQLKALGAEYSFKRMFKHYRRLKNRRDKKEEAIQFVKANKNKVFKDTTTNDAEFVQISKKSRDGSFIVLTGLGDNIPYYRKTREVSLEQFLRQYKSSPLYNKLLGN